MAASLSDAVANLGDGEPQPNHRIMTFPDSLLRLSRRVILFTCAVLAATSFAAESPPKVFDLPPDSAEVSLKRFAAQAGVEVLFTTQAVAQVRTAEVKGTLPPADALRRLLVGTGLVASRDEQTGMFHVRRSENDSSPKNQAVPRADPTPARTPAAATSRNAASESDEAIVLSPFVVQNARDRGYHASSTLAGTRLNTPLSDIGAPVSVVTKEFLQDTGVTDINQLFLYTVSTEGSGLEGNFSATEAAGEVPVQDSSRARPQSATRVRGLVAVDLTRDYFLSTIPLEDYNVERIDISRGPNAILFGLGSPSGVTNGTLLKPSYRKNAFNLHLRAGDHESFRGVADANLVLVPDRVALRIATLGKETHWEQNPTFERDKRVFTAVKLNPFKDTTLLVNHENGAIKSRRPLTISPIDRLSTWFITGKPTWNASQPASATNVNPTFPGSGPTPLYNTPNVVLVNPSFFWQWAVPLEVNGQGPTMAGFQGRRPAAASAPGFPAPTNLEFFDARQLGEFSDTLRTTGLPLSVFNFRKQLIGGETGFGQRDFNATNLSLEQHLLDRRVGVEVAYSRESYDEFFREPYGKERTNQIHIDVNTFLMDGRTNPNFGRPFILSWESGDLFDTVDRESVRATLYGRWDAAESFKGGFGRWLGRHTLTGFGGTQEVKGFKRRSILGWSGGSAALDLNETSIVNQRRLMTNFVYVGPSVARANSLEDVRLDFNVTARLARAGDTYDVAHWDRASQAWRTDNYRVVEGFVDALKSRQTISSEAGILQSYWLKDTIVTTVGWRQDRAKTYVSSAIPRFASGDLQGSIDANALVLDGAPINTIKGSIWTKSIVAKLPRSLELPFGLDLSVHYNDSENLQPLSGELNVFGQPIAPPTGKTKEYGFTVSALQSRASMRVNWYETSLLNARTSDISTGIFGQILNIDFQSAQFWYEGLNSGFTSVSQANIDRLVGTIPQSVKDLVGYTVVTNPDGRRSPQFVYPTNLLRDVTNFEAKGIEIEGTLNLTDNWRLAFNVAKQQTQKSNTAPFLTEYVAQRLPIWTELGGLPRVPGVNEIPGSFLTEANRLAVSAIANLRALDGIYSAELRKWRTNLVTNYTFGTDSRIKGIGIGGAWRWQDKAAIDYPRIRNASGVFVADVSRPFFSPSTSQIDLWVSYRRPILNRKVQWKLQLNVGDVFADDELIPVTVHSDGTPAMVRLSPPRTWFLSSTFEY